MIANFYTVILLVEMLTLEELAIDTRQLPSDGSSLWAGMGDYLLRSPDDRHFLRLTYVAEPPFGDCYQTLSIDGIAFPGWAWGCCFAFSPESRYVAFSWMARRYERQTVVVDVQARRFSVLPEYIFDFTFCWPALVGCGKWEGLTYRFNSQETWQAY